MCVAVQNGVQVYSKATNLAAPVATRGNNQFGYNGALEAFSGSLAFVNIYHDVSVTPAEVAALYTPLAAPHHDYDFRMCTDSSTPIPDLISPSLEATLTSVPSCLPSGLLLDRSSQISLPPSKFGGAMSVEFVVMLSSYNLDLADGSVQVVDFSKANDEYPVEVGVSADAGKITVGLPSYRSSGPINPNGLDGSTPRIVTDDVYGLGKYTHVVAVVKESGVKVYKNGVLAYDSTQFMFLEPELVLRDKLLIGTNIEGTLAYVRVYHGVELDAAKVTSLYADRTKCPPSQSSPDATTYDCYICSAGRYNPTRGATECTDCPRGTYLGAPGGASVADCQGCAAGKSSAAGKRRCSEVT